MKTIEITVMERIDVPDDAVLEYASTGNACGIRLADGRVVKPWIALEIEEDDDAHDMTSDEIRAIGIDRDLGFERTLDLI